MKVNLQDYRSITILVNPQKNIVIFPRSHADFPVELADGTIVNSMVQDVYFPIELKYPYTLEELAEKIEYGIQQWNIHKCYNSKDEKKILEAKYYGERSIKRALNGKLYMDLGWDDIQGKYVTFSLPLKGGQIYIEMDHTQLSEDADWTDFANVVMKYINMDYTQLHSYETYKSKLNM